MSKTIKKAMFTSFKITTMIFGVGLISLLISGEEFKTTLWDSLFYEHTSSNDTLFAIKFGTYNNFLKVFSTLFLTFSLLALAFYYFKENISNN